MQRPLEVRWPHALGFLLGLWLLSSPFTMGYASPELRASDVVSGTAVALLSAIALLRGWPWLKWSICAIGIWVSFAPLAFWATDPAPAANGILIGTLIAVCSVVIPSVLHPREVGAEIPEGWSYNPSAWGQRAPIIGLAFFGFLIARYLSAFQLGHIRSVWEPFFGGGTETILTSRVSRAFPVSDAGLGAWSYLLDAISGAIGGTRRWRTMPWVVILFGLMVIPPGVVSITLVILQPVAVGAWCTLCLATAFVMLLMVPPAIDEVVAAIQHLIGERRAGRSVWRAFWGQGRMAESEERVVLGFPGGGGQVPWGLVVSALLGAGLLAAPGIFDARDGASDLAHFLGALITTSSVIAIAPVARLVRFANCILALLLAVGIWFAAGAGADYRAVMTVIAIFVFATSFPLGPITDRFGDYDRWARWNPFGKRSSGDRGRIAA